MIEILQQLFSFNFLVRALIVGSLVALCAALLGVVLVLKRFSMIGDGLSHVGFGALSIAMACNLAPLAVAVPLVIAAAFVLLRLGEHNSLHGDSAIALISSGALAAGVIVTSLSSGLNADVYSYLFGSILAMSDGDVILSVVLCAAVLFVCLFCYHRIFALAFDESFARATGMHAGAYNTIIALLTAITIVVGMRIMGTMLISSLIIFPALSAMRVFKSFRSVMICAAVVSVVCFSLGVVGSYVFATPTGASVVAANLIVFVLMWLTGKISRRS